MVPFLVLLLYCKNSCNIKSLIPNIVPYAGLAGPVIIEITPNVCTSPPPQFQSINQPCSPIEDRTLLNPHQPLNAVEQLSLPEHRPVDAVDVDRPSESVVEKV